MDPPPPYSWPASRRSRWPDGLGSSTNNKEADKFRFGGPGPRDPLEDLKILFLRKLEECWREIEPGGPIPPAADAVNRASTVAGAQRHLAIDRGVVGRRGKIYHRHRRRKRESKADEQEASSATSSNGPCTDRGHENRGTDIVVTAVIDATNRGHGTRGDGRQWLVKNKDFRGGCRWASGASPHGERILTRSGER